MGQNSQEVAYGFGQLGSAFSNVDQSIIPPKGHVIVAIQFLEHNEPLILTPEKLDEGGPGFLEITGSAQTAILADNTFNHNGIASVALTNNAGSNITTVEMSAGANALVKPGQFVLLAAVIMTEDGNSLMSQDTQTPSPIYNGPNARGVKIKSVSGDAVTLEGHGTTTFVGLSPSNQMLICLDEQHGAGGIRADGVIFPQGLTVVGRWTEFKGEEDRDVICYFGK